MLSQDHDADVRSAADDQRDDATTGLVVPGPRADSAARLLELTARDTDQWRADAQAEAAEIVAAARQEAETLLRTAQREAGSMVESARLEAGRTLDDARAAADDVHAESETRRTRSEAEVARLQQVASEHDQRLRGHLQEILERLDSERR